MTPRFIATCFCAVLASACGSNGHTLPPLKSSSASSRFTADVCEVGIYRNDASAFLTITRSGDGFRYTFDDGSLGNPASAGSMVECGLGNVQVDGAAIWDKVPLVQTNTTFRSGDVTLVGRLIQPPGAGKDTPLIVYAHGSEPTGMIEHHRDPYQMVGRGVSVFVFDKRGTGQSEGQYTQNFPLLAEDLVAGSQEAKRLAEGRFGRFGLVGLSQGGWIAPLAADRAGAEFIGIGYGLVADITEEDAAQVQKELRDAGYSDDILEVARRITDVTKRIAVSDYTDGLKELTALQIRYSAEPWFSVIRGSYTGVFLGKSADELRANGVPQFNNLNIDWTLNPMDVMRGVEAPQLWVVAGEDREAPIDLTIERLSVLRAEGKTISIYKFPNTDHGMWEFKQDEDGTREYLKVTDGFYDLMADWAKDRVTASYGSAVVVTE